jgi:hypothetical protein
MEGANVEAAFGDGRDPLLILLDQFDDKIDELLPVEIGEGESFRGPLEPQGVLLDPEEPNFPLLIFISFRPLIALDCIVETGAEGVQVQVLKGPEGGIGPAEVSIIVDGNHMVRVVLAEA